jgi:flagellar biosynthesis protein FlhB
MSDEKTLDPTPHRRERARREGHVAKSQDLGSAAVLLLGAGILVMLGGGLAAFLVEYCRRQLGGQAWLNVDADFVASQWNAVLWALSRCLLPILGLLCLAGVAATVLQIGFLFTPDRIAWKLDRVDPLGGLRRIFSGTNIARLWFGLVKLTVVSAVAGAVLYSQRHALLGLAALPPSALASQMLWVLLATVAKIGAALFVLAMLDYAYQRWRHEQDLKMTPQELREELRNLEGDPQVVARRKEARRDTAARRASQASAISADDA